MLGRNRFVKGDTHHCGGAIWRPTHDHVCDVASDVAKKCADPADASGYVVVSHEEQVICERYFDCVAIDSDQYGTFAFHEGARNGPLDSLHDP